MIDIALVYATLAALIFRQPNICLRRPMADVPVQTEVVFMADNTRKPQSLRIPDYPAGHSSDIRPPKPGYPATLI